MHLLGAAEALFGIPVNGTFDATVFYQLGNSFFKSMQKLLDAITYGECDLQEEVPKAKKKLMEVVIPETGTRKKCFHATF